MSSRTCALVAFCLLVPSIPGRADEEVVVQIMGMGPVKTTQTEVDEKGEPVRRK